MLGKRPRATMRRTSSVSLIGSGPLNGDSGRLPAAHPHPKESKLKSSQNGGGSAAVPVPATATTPAAGASQPPPRLVIGFHPKVPFYDGTTPTPTALSPNSSEMGNHRSSALSGGIGGGGGADGGGGLMVPPPQSSIARRSAGQSTKSPSGSPRSALGDLLAAGSRPWERKDGGVGLGIVAALNSSNNSNIGSNISLEEENIKVRVDDGRMYGVTPTAGGAYNHPHHPPIPSSIFAPSRASPPIPIHPPPAAPHSDYNCPSHCTHQNCHPASAFGPVSASLRLDPILPEHEPSSFRLGGVGLGGGGGRPIMFSPSPVNHHHHHHPSPTPRSRLVVNNTPAATITGFGISWEQQQQQQNQHLQLHFHQQHHQQHNQQMADMEVDRTDSLVLGTPPLVSHAGLIRPSPNNSWMAPNNAYSAGYSPNFLDACYLCRRRLGGDRDIYIYRGDRAFCSQECRSQQIVNNERSEKCSSAVMKIGGGSESRTTTQRTRVMAAGTAAAA